MHKWNVREKVSFSFYRHQAKLYSWRTCLWNVERFDLGGMFQRVFEKVPVSFVQLQRDQQNRKLRNERCQHKTGARRTESKGRSQISICLVIVVMVISILPKFIFNPDELQYKNNRCCILHIDCYQSRLPNSRLKKWGMVSLSKLLKLLCVSRIAARLVTRTDIRL